jgi:CBS domain-containing protein/RNA polymerase-binding transcription factor DksA
METQIKMFMTGMPTSIDADAPVQTALELMTERAIRHLPVVDRDHRVVGLLALDDLRSAFPGPSFGQTGDASQPTPVGEVMTHAPRTLETGLSLEVAADALAESGADCVPIVDEDGRLAGLLTVKDCLHALVTILWAERRREGESPPPPAAGRGLVDALRVERAALADQLDEYERTEQALTLARREEPLDLAEHSEDAREAGLTERLADLASRRLRAVERALERAEHGSLGVCERCGGEIPEGRLRALPETTLCVRCATELEGGQR